MVELFAHSIGHLMAFFRFLIRFTFLSIIKTYYYYLTLFCACNNGQIIFEHQAFDLYSYKMRKSLSSFVLVDILN